VDKKQATFFCEANIPSMLCDTRHS
jgi:hypothetical protein